MGEGADGRRDNEKAKLGGVIKSRFLPIRVKAQELAWFGRGASLQPVLARGSVHSLSEASAAPQPGQ